MKNGLVRYTGQLISVYYYNGVVQVTPKTSTFQQVSSSPILKGDKKRTVFLPWSYEVNRYSTFKGQNDWLTWYNSQPQIRDGVAQSGIVQFYDAENYLAKNLPDESNYVYNKCLAKLYDKVRGSIDLSIDVIQTRQTVRMFNAVASIREYTRSRSWRALISGASRARLEFVYGWKPLANELFDSLDELTNVTINEIENFKTRANTPVPSTLVYPEFQNMGTVECLAKRNGFFTCEIGIRMRTRSHDPARWTSLNPVSMLYEATPYSFVLDWVYNLGGYLRSLETSLIYGNSFVSGYVTQGLFYDATGSCSKQRKTFPPNQTSIYTTSAQASSRYRKMTRSVLTSMPVPRLPSFKVNLGTDRLFNLASLLGVLIKAK